MRNLSTSGDQSHFKPQHNPTQLMKPMLLRSTPTSRIQNERVPRTNKSGSPELNPKKNMRKQPAHDKSQARIVHRLLF